MLQTIKEDCRTLRDGVPGKRFRDYVDERRERRGTKWSAGRVASFTIGITLMFFGLGIGWLPGPGGFLAIVGLALVAQEIPVLADFLDCTEMFVRNCVSAIRERLRKAPPKPDQ